MTASLLYLLQLTLGYVVMFLVMTHQLSVIVVIIVGLGSGYLICNPYITSGMDILFLKQEDNQIADISCCQGNVETVPLTSVS